MEDLGTTAYSLSESPPGRYNISSTDGFSVVPSVVMMGCTPLAVISSD